MRPLFERAAREFGRIRADADAARPVDASNADGCWADEQRNVAKLVDQRRSIA